jgi:4-amino-4-deoxy-L-arabinose transferase-like glycosyltransferase
MLKQLRLSFQAHRQRWLVAAIVLAAAALRIILLTTGRVVWGDEPSYLWLGRNLFTGHGFSFTGHPDPHHSPFYPIVTGLLYLVTHNMELSSDICYVVFGALLAVPIFLLARRIYGRRVGYWAAILVSAYPALTGAVMHWGTMTEPIYYLLVFSGFYWALVAVEDDKLWGYVGAGAAFSLAYLTRPEAIGYLAAAVLFWALVLLCERRLFRWRTLVTWGAYALAFLALFFPYAFFVHQQTGSWQVTEKAGVTFVTCLGLASHDVVAFDQATWGLDSTGHEVFFFSSESYNVSMEEYIVQHPREFAQMVWGNLREFQQQLLSRRMLPTYFLPLLALAFFGAVWNRARLRRELLLWLTVLPLLGFVLFFIQERYIGAALPTIAIWLALGLSTLGDWCARTWDNLRHDREETALVPQQPRGWLGRALVAWPLVLVVAWFLYQEPAIMRGTAIGSVRPGQKSVGLWLGAQVGRDAVVMSRYPSIAFYADTVWRPTPNASVEQMLEYARFKQVDYLVLDESETEQMRPQYRALLDGPLPAPLERVHVDDTDGDRLVVIKMK